MCPETSSDNSHHARSLQLDLRVVPAPQPSASHAPRRAQLPKVQLVKMLWCTGSDRWSFRFCAQTTAAIRQMCRNIWPRLRQG